MQISRRSLIACGAAACLPALAQTAYPAKPVKLIVPFAPGGGTDGVARYIAQKLNQNHGYTVVVDNKPGAGGNLGAEAALREPADGYTLLAISGSYAVNAVLTKPNFDPIAAIQPITQFSRESTVLVVSANSPFKTLGDLIAEAKRKPGGVAYGSSGMGGFAHLATEYFASAAGIKMTHVPYKGTGAALIDLAGGQVAFIMSGVASVAGLAKGGKLRILAVDAPARLTNLPTVPTFAEQGVRDFRAALWHGLVAPRGIPADVLAKLNADVNAVLRNPEVVAKFTNDDVGPAGGSAAAFGEVIRADIDRWRAVVKQADIKLS